MHQLATLTSSSTEFKMSSIQISEETGKRHAHVKEDIRNMLNSLNFQCTDFTAHYLDGRNRRQEMFNLNKDLTMTLITGYSVPMRHAVIVRVRELESLVNSLPQVSANLTISEIESLIEDRVTQLLSEFRITFLQPATEQISTVIERPDDLLLPTELGFFAGVSSQRINRILMDLNFQFKDPTIGYQPTSQARGLYEDLGHKVVNGRIAIRFKWKRQVLRAIPRRYLP